MGEIYTDGVGVERCVTCGVALQDKAGELLVYIRRSDAEAIATLLVQLPSTYPAAWDETIARLEHAIGNRVANLAPGPTTP